MNRADDSLYSQFNISQNSSYRSIILSPELPPDLKVFLEWLTKPEEELKEEQLVSSLTNEKPESFVPKMSTPVFSRVDTANDLVKGERITLFIY